ncbi:MAG: hypothetical protein JWO57_1525 [Pseudonocardiales bacterium]|nr:hypothetical protein [Pseudonocardiales bacterium]
MTDDMHDSRKRTRPGLKIALVGAGIAAGAIGATAMGASAASTSTTSGTPAAYTGSSAPAAPNGSSAPKGHGGSTPVRSDEKSLSASVTATLKAAALKAVPGGTVYRIESDAGDGVYEAHMTKADGSQVTVKFDKSLNVTKVETGMGTGDPAPAGQGPGH